MKDQIDVAVRRSPKYSVFMGLGAVLGVVVTGVLALFVDPAAMPTGYTVSKGLGLMLLVLGVGGLFLGGLLALILDWIGRRRAKQFRVEAQIDMVDDPKEIARRRLAEVRGEGPDATDSAGPDAPDATDHSVPDMADPSAPDATDSDVAGVASGSADSASSERGGEPADAEAVEPDERPRSQEPGSTV
ncbi:MULTISPECIES: hypothetical protein [unclassified Brevibacterium]|uniref:hypothetical protein n=1 Tax=unclassified Brevibacterium TaxID=2614124 RepID=UPI001E372E31|nr:MULTISPECIES: hypothetical protein [unclassified Brevibacterium]MDK8436731.1 hypothetical protein [Brevibacterium sp. H-BE7]